MDLYQFLVSRIGYNEPIFSKDLLKDVDLSPNALRQSLKRLVDKGKICRYDNSKGIFFIPDPNSLLKKNTLSVSKIIDKKYLFKNNERIGYETGLSFSNMLNLTTQNPVTIELVTKAEKRSIRVVNYNKRKVTLRKPRVDINNDNYKILQVLDLLTNFERLSAVPISSATKNILKYLKGINVTGENLNAYLENYPSKTSKILMGSELYNELTQR
ncbi:DUF6088 family protein [Lentibacillus sp. Marseille-P4043]|uniref:DUF6088 family protein n=1 Tax=Lentibacillus sp. Marseille-P4043 TaxID=2040293 RepID=UPI000D0B215D|nr:DUF6088 family protein [Lentibacillus sp. Marseille-P4043]